MPNLPAARAAIAQIEPDVRVHDLTDEELASIVAPWQPIETAPDDEDVLLKLPRYGATLYPFYEMAVGQRMHDGNWYSSGDSPDPLYKLHTPVEWMTLPPL